MHTIEREPSDILKTLIMYRLSQHVEVNELETIMWESVEGITETLPVFLDLLKMAVIEARVILEAFDNDTSLVNHIDILTDAIQEWMEAEHFNYELRFTRLCEGLLDGLMVDELWCEKNDPENTPPGKVLLASFNRSKATLKSKSTTVH